jgi:FkbM family methyltransferase
MKHLIQNLLRPFGYQVQDMRKIGRDPWRDIQILLQTIPEPVCFDVGAHRGETLKTLWNLFPKAAIHAFEPDPDNFAALTVAVKIFPNTRLYPLALGDCQQQAKLQKTSFSMSNSLLSVSPTLKSEAHKKIGEVEVTVTTVDRFCQDQKIETIDLLKTDCQGFDLRVLKGATKYLSEKRIKVVQCESMFALEYNEQGWFYEILRFMTDIGYVPVSFGEPARNKHNEIMWTDVIFKPRHTEPIA